MANYSRMTERLCTALNKAGREISVERKVFFSIVYQKLCTVWTIKEGRELRLKTYSAAEAVKYLAALYKEERADGTDDAES